ncbi:acyl-CoA dehydrogenase family protein [Nannocystis pusilla]|uniref:Acyl-CoA dehydrogenase/oxidase C-terminal domain-containing protein n=1 Tax=Nannocystis pusilla TaxID=889268 RepID=A0ABS7U5V9_9BACT|nr:acyl-CoA dehydrogenase family protein [Nannocystis pusilla]MBZ5715690.1 hypothetical protein [Nannocystis pusilla]
MNDRSDRWRELRRAASALAAAALPESMRDRLAALDEAGILAMNAPAATGGFAATLAENVEILRVLAASCGSTAWALAGHCALAGALRSSATLQHQAPGQGCTIDHVHSGMPWSAASSGRNTPPAFLGCAAGGPFATTPVAAAGPTATPTLGGWTLDGVLPLVAGFEACTHIFVAAHGTAAPLLLLVPRPGPELAVVVAPWEGPSMPVSGAHSVELRGLPVAAGDLVAGEDAAAVLARVQRWYSACQSAVFLGLAERAHELAVAVGRASPRGALPGVQFALGRMRALLAAMEALLAESCTAPADVVDDPAGEGVRACVLRYYLTNEAPRVVQLALEVIGAPGVRERAPIAQILRDVQLGPLLPLDNDAARELIGKSALGVDLAASPRWQ